MSRRLTPPTIRTFRTPLFSAQVRAWDPDTDDEIVAEIKVGDVVGFKSDIEQFGGVEAIERDEMGRTWIKISAGDEPFEGEYLGGEFETEELAGDCWKEYPNL